jgi:uncharacterized protein
LTGWRLSKLDDLELAGWVDPAGHRPVWSTLGFRRVAEALPQHEVLHLVALQDGQPVLLAPVLRSRQPGGLLFYDVPAMVGDETAFGSAERLEPGEREVLAGIDLKAARETAYPSLAVGMYGGHHGIVVHPERDATQACRGMLSAVADLADELGCASHGLLYATNELMPLLDVGPQHQVALLGAESVLECDGSSWEDYLRSLSSRRRIRVQSERRSYLEGPLTTDIATGPGSIGEDLVDLRCNLRKRYGLPDQRERTINEFDALVRHCGDELVVIRSRGDGETLGFVIYLRDEDSMYARTAGFDYDRLTIRDFCYFNIVYYDALEWGLPLGVRRIEVGLANYPAKRTRGCRFEARHGIFTLPDGPLRTALSLQDNGERARLAAECGSVEVKWT